MKFKLNNYNRNLSENELVDDLKSVAKQLGKETVKMDEYSLYGKYHASTLWHRFGSWAKCIEKAGLKPARNQINNIPTDIFIKDLQKVAGIINKDTVLSKEYEQYGSFDRGTLVRKFGSWSKCLELAGLQLTGYDKDITDEDLFLEIQNVWISLGRQPTTTDVKDGLTKYSLNTFTRRFGSWRKALEAFLIYVNQEELESEVNTNELLEIEVKIDANIVIKHKTKRDVNDRLRIKVLLRDNCKCRICGASPATDYTIQLHMDHVVPWSKGGETVIDNLQTLCSKCNLGKSDLIISIYK